MLLRVSGIVTAFMLLYTGLIVALSASETICRLFLSISLPAQQKWRRIKLISLDAG